MAIIVKRDDRANAVIFEGSSLPSYWNGLLTASLSSGSTDRIDIINTAGTSGSWDDVNADKAYEYYEVEYTLFRDADNGVFANATEAINHINSTANQHSPLSGFETIATGNRTSTETYQLTSSAEVATLIEFTGSNSNYNTFVSADITQIYNTSSYTFNFDQLVPQDSINVTIEYIVNTDVTDAGHELEMRFTNNSGLNYSISTTQTQVQSAAEDVEYITSIPFYIGDDLALSGANSGSAQLYFNPDEDATIKIKNITTFLTR